MDTHTHFGTILYAAQMSAHVSEAQAFTFMLNVNFTKNVLKFEGFLSHLSLSTSPGL